MLMTAAFEPQYAAVEGHQLASWSFVIAAGRLAPLAERLLDTSETYVLLVV